MSYQTRYAQFARVRGFAPGDEPLMHEYIEWIKGKWREWKALTGHKSAYLTQEDHTAFDAWLSMEAA